MSDRERDAGDPLDLRGADWLLRELGGGSRQPASAPPSFSDAPPTTPFSPPPPSFTPPAAAPFTPPPSRAEEPRGEAADWFSLAEPTPPTAPLAPAEPPASEAPRFTVPPRGTPFQGGAVPPEPVAPSPAAAPPAAAPPAAAPPPGPVTPTAPFALTWGDQRIDSEEALRAAFRGLSEPASGPSTPSPPMPGHDAGSSTHSAFGPAADAPAEPTEPSAPLAPIAEPGFDATDPFAGFTPPPVARSSFTPLPEAGAGHDYGAELWSALAEPDPAPPVAPPAAAAAPAWNPEPPAPQAWQAEPPAPAAWQPEPPAPQAWQPEPPAPAAPVWQPEPVAPAAWQPEPTVPQAWQPEAPATPAWQPEPTAPQAWQPEPPAPAAWQPEPVAPAAEAAPAAPEAWWRSEPQPEQPAAWSQTEQPAAWSQPEQPAAWSQTEQPQPEQPQQPEQSPAHAPWTPQVPGFAVPAAAGSSVLEPEPVDDLLAALGGSRGATAPMPPFDDAWPLREPESASATAFDAPATPAAADDESESGLASLGLDTAGFDRADAAQLAASTAPASWSFRGDDADEGWDDERPDEPEEPVYLWQLRPDPEGRDPRIGADGALRPAPRLADLGGTMADPTPTAPAPTAGYPAFDAVGEPPGRDGGLAEDPTDWFSAAAAGGSAAGGSAAGGAPAGPTPRLGGPTGPAGPGGPGDGPGGRGPGGSGSGDGSGSGGSPRRTRRTLLWVGGAVVTALVLVGLFFLGTRLVGGEAAVTSPPSDTADTAASETPSAGPTGPQPAGVHAWDTLFGGECVDPFTNAWAQDFTVVDCAQPHAAQLVYRGVVNADPAAPFPGEAELAAQMNVLCTAAGVIDVAAAAGAPDLQVQGAYPVTEEQWAAGQRNYYCFVNRAGGEPLTGSLQGPGPAV